MMRDDKLIELFEFYTRDGVPEPARLPDSAYKEYFDLITADSGGGEDAVMRRAAINHAAWIAKEALSILKEAQAIDEQPGKSGRSKREKAHRWLGFIQATLWLCGVYTLDELKEHSRKCSDKPDQEETKRG